ncbi:hypothetical protein PYW07_002144 [Mythimna separata]|uniref:Uncharacterized protein n=1 Tax=Mythimna separata TaxID=271217 RepID=A0AAD7YNF0_MYTSE|nr:hypothetical protein PYW07_002144 [Mythimna separata]
MTYGAGVMKIPILFLFTSVFLRTNCDVFYVPKITDRVFGCDNFDNDFLDCDGLKLGSEKGEEGDDAAKLSGSIVTSKDIESMYDVEIDIWKILDLADEYMYNTRVNFCSSLDNADAPWAPIVEKLNISGCPVPISTFEVHGLTISLDSMKDVMCHDFCGEYLIQMAFMDGADKISCHVIQICIVEENDEDEK